MRVLIPNKFVCIDTERNTTVGVNVRACRNCIPFKDTKSTFLYLKNPTQQEGPTYINFTVYILYWFNSLP
jgi:hypothetical protein